MSLGHAGLFGIAAYATGYMLQAGFGHPIAILTALIVGMASMAVYAVLSLRATGIGFIMITLALGEIIWGLAYRWISITGGDNGINLHGRPQPFGIAINSANAFYYTTLVVFLVALAAVTVFVRSPLGAALMGTRDQPRRMNALGYHVWAIRFWACMFSGLLTAIVRHPVRLLHAVHQPAGARPDRLGRGAADGDLRRRRHPARARSSAPRWWWWSRAWSAASSSAGTCCSAPSSSPSSS